MVTHIFLSKRKHSGTCIASKRRRKKIKTVKPHRHVSTIIEPQKTWHKKKKEKRDELSSACGISDSENSALKRGGYEGGDRKRAQDSWRTKRHQNKNFPHRALVFDYERREVFLSNFDSKKRVSSPRGEVCDENKKRKHTSRPALAFICPDLQPIKLWLQYVLRVLRWQWYALFWQQKSVYIYILRSIYYVDVI